MTIMWVPVQQVQKASFCLFLAILGSLKTETQKECVIAAEQMKVNISEDRQEFV